MRTVIITTLALWIAGAGGAMAATNDTETATLAGGCFWCMEAVFEELVGVRKVESGFAGGGEGHVSYKEVCGGGTDHAEVVQVQFDPTVLSFEELLTVFFSVHDPTTKNRQGADVGTQYRSAVFWHDEVQRDVAAAVIAELNAAKVFPAPIVTELTPFDAFVRADDGHQDYYSNNKSQSYCRVVISPKLEKFRKIFHDRLKR